MTELDLDRGDEERADQIADAQERQEGGRARRRGRSRDSSGRFSSSDKGGGKSDRPKRGDSNLVERLVGAFGRLADQRAARNDEELATAIRDHAQAMSQGLVSLTRTVTFLRMPLLYVLSFLEPVLAFWHVGRILLGRFAERRQRVMAERELAAAEAATAGQ